MNENGALFWVLPVKGTYSHDLTGVWLLWVWGGVKIGKLEEGGGSNLEFGIGALGGGVVGNFEMRKLATKRRKRHEEGKSQN